MNRFFSLGILSFALSAPQAWGHARLKPGSGTPPRNESTGLKTGPCGNVPRGSTPQRYKPGAEITVEWEETINHPGFFIIKFSKENDAGFDDFVLVPNFKDTQDGAVNVNDPKTYHQYSVQVKLPDVSCSACTLQLIQHMDDRPDQPYFSCSDLELTADGESPAPGPTGPGNPSNASKPEKPQGLRLEKGK